jgi:hypothetical protein
MARTIVNISDTVKTFQEKTNTISLHLGDKARLTTTVDSDFVGSINELDSDIGARPHTNLTTDAKTLTGAANEMDGRLDSINNTELLSPRMTLSSTSATNVIRGSLNIGNNVQLGSDQTDAITFNGLVNSNVLPDSSGAKLTLGSSAKKWGNIHTQDVTADSATLATAKISDLTSGRITFAGTSGELQDDADLTYNTTTDTFAVSNLDIGTQADLASAKVEDLTNNRVVIVGTGGELEDDANLTFDGSTFSVGTNVSVSGNITVTGNVDGADVAALNTRVEPTRAFGATFTATTVMAALNELKTQADLLDSGSSERIAQIGDLAQLNTTEDSDLVGAINSVYALVDSATDFRSKISATDAGGDGSFAYNSTTGVMTYTGPSASEVRAHFSAGEGIDISSGQISGEDATSSNKGIAKFDTSNFSVSSGNVTIKDNGIILGTETTGNYVDSAIGGTGITVTHTPGEGSTITVAITSGGVDTTQLAADAVTNAKIADNAVDIAQLAHRTANHVLKMNSSGVPTSGTIATANIADDAVTNAKIGAGAVNTTELAADAVTGAKIADDAINSEHYTNGSIDTAHIGNDQVTYAKIQNVATANRVLGATTAGAAVGEVQISTAMIAADAVTGAKIADDTINSEHYAAGSIDAEHLASNSVTQAKLADDAVGSAELKSVVSLVIKNSAGTALKTIYGAGS